MARPFRPPPSGLPASLACGMARPFRPPPSGPPASLACGMAQIPTNISDHIGNTPMVRLSRLEPAGVELYGKLEAYNPGGSVKDRIGIAMINAAEADGRIEPGRTTIVEATSGNTGIALAFVCAAK